LARTAAVGADDTDADDDADDNVADLPHEYKYNKGAVGTLSSSHFSKRARNNLVLCWINVSVKI